MWKAWVSIPVPHSPTLLSHCWAVYQGRWAQGSLCVSQRDAYWWVGLCCAHEGGGEAVERGRRLSLSFKIALRLYGFFQSTFGIAAPGLVARANGTVGCRLSKRPTGPIDGLMDSTRRVQTCAHALLMPGCFFFSRHVEMTADIKQYVRSVNTAGHVAPTQWQAAISTAPSEIITQADSLLNHGQAMRASVYLLCYVN